MAESVADRQSQPELGETLAAALADLIRAVDGPISSPIPTAKPDRSASAPPAVVAECGYASIVAELAEDGQTQLYRASFAETMVAEMAAEGCTRFFQGCNVCNIRYEGCSDAERAACSDAACLEAACERKVVCSVKTCVARGRVPTCQSRLARTACLRTLSD